MAKQSDDTEKNQYQTLTWGTWEELLLACAVHRYGTNSWDSVAMELQKRSSTFHHLLTAKTCQQKFDDLKRRFTDQNDIQVPENDDDDDDRKTTTTTTTTAHTTVPWLDELKKLRVAELRRDVERYDLSIVSLQSKVKRLTEECEQSFTESEKEREKSSDLEKRDGDGELEKSPPNEVAGKEISGEVNVRDSQSVNESNSTDPKGDNLETKPEEEEREPVESVNGEPIPAGKSGKPAREGSCNGSSDTVAKESAGTPVEKADPARESGDSPESVAESKGGVVGGGGGEEGAKENSDMQSSVKSEPENDDQSPAIKRETVESQPLVDFLDMVRSHRLGSVFERRLESQETTNYRSLVRQHIDLETIRMRLQEGWYSGYNCKFFRDLLLLSNNALVFYGNKSSESKAAIELRQLVSKEMACKSPLKLESALQEQIPVPPVDPPIKPEPEPSDSLLSKQKIAVTLTVCRKRSSITAKASATSSERKREQTATRLAEEKPVINSKQQEKSLVDADEEHEVTKKRTRERHTPSAKTSTKNSKSRANNTNTIKNPEPKLNENSEPKGDKKNNTTMTSASASANAKKQGAANFLNRMKKGSSSNNGSFLDSVKSSVNKSDNSRGGAENKKNGSSKNDIVVRRDQPPRRGSNGKQVKEQESPTKRNVGRPPKRAAALPPPPPISGKRSREGGGTDSVASSRQAKKRLRK